MTEKERTAWKALRTWFVDDQTSSAFVAKAIDYLLTDEPDKLEPLNAPPPAGLPCWAWTNNKTRWLWEVDGERSDCQPTWYRWQPCFVPLDAEPGSVWFLWKDGEVTSGSKGYRPDAYDREQSRYIYTVEEGSYE